MADALLKPKLIPTPPKTVIFTPTNALTRQVLNNLNKTRELKSRPPLSGQFNFYQDDDLGVVGPATGAPAAVMALEPLLLSGTKRIFLLGTCGGLAPDNSTNSMELFDIVFPDGFISEEGTSQHYPVDGLSSKRGRFSISSEAQNKFKSACLEEKLNVLSGLVWTTDAPYRETVQKVENFYTQGAIAVDMEYSAVAKLCLYYQAELVAAFVISDILGSEWINGMGKGNLKDKINSLALIANRVFKF